MSNTRSVFHNMNITQHEEFEPSTYFGETFCVNAVGVVQVHALREPDQSSVQKN